MSVESAADRAAFTSTDEFAVNVSWSVGGADAVDVAAIPETGGVVNDGGDGPGLVSRHGLLMVADENVPSGAGEGDSVTVSGIAFLVRSVLPDGTGLTEVHLEVDRS